jgi:hypothetical protein
VQTATWPTAGQLDWWVKEPQESRFEQLWSIEQVAFLPGPLDQDHVRLAVPKVRPAELSARQQDPLPAPGSPGLVDTQNAMAS